MARVDGQLPSPALIRSPRAGDNKRLPVLNLEGGSGPETVPLEPEEVRLEPKAAYAPRVRGKFLEADGRRFLVKGVAYGTFAPDATGAQFPPPERVAQDFAMMAAAGINTVRTYTVPSLALLDQAAHHGLKVMVGVPWAQHLAFLDDRPLARQIRRAAAAQVRALGGHSAALLFALGNEIPPSIVRWHGRARVERFLRDLFEEAKTASPSSLLAYVNFPPTEFLDTWCYDVCAFNVYLHREPDLRAYLARLQHLAGAKPLLLAEAGADSIRESADGQARLTAAHVRAAFAEGACGAVAFSWTDEWWRGGHDVNDWAFGLVDRERRPKPALAAVEHAYAEVPFSATERAAWPKVSVVVCAYNAADTIDDCLESVQRLAYPDLEVIVGNDGSREATGVLARRRPGVRVIDVPNGGLSAARNIGLERATGEIVAFTDADVRVDPDWLTYLVQPMLHSDVAGSGGPNVVPEDDPWVAQCVARAPGGPTHVLLDDRFAEHVPGCNMAFRRDALLSIGGFNPIYLRAGDDVDVCWRLQARGLKIGFAPSALVWHHHRTTIKGYWRQQAGYGEGEAWLEAHHPEKFLDGAAVWRGRIYSPLPFVRALSGRRVNTGVWGTAAFPSVYRTDVLPYQFLPHSPAWFAVSTGLLASGALVALTPYAGAAVVLSVAGALGWLVTVGRCVVFACQSDMSPLTPIDRWWRPAKLSYRILIGWLHFIQPLARLWGRVRGMWSPPVVIDSEKVSRLPWRAPVPSREEALGATLLLVGGSAEERFWSERWITHDAILTEIVGWLRAVRPARPIEVDDGWRADRDLSLEVGRWGWLDVRALVEEHKEGRCLLRIGTRLRPSLLGAATALALALVLVGATSAGIALRWPSMSAACVAGVTVIVLRAAWGTTRAVAVLRRAVAGVAGTLNMQRLPAHRTAGSYGAFRLRPATPSQVLQAVVACALVASALASGSSIARDVVRVARAVTAPAATAPGVTPVPSPPAPVGVPPAPLRPPAPPRGTVAAIGETP